MIEGGKLPFDRPAVRSRRCETPPIQLLRFRWLCNISNFPWFILYYLLKICRRLFSVDKSKWAMERRRRRKRVMVYRCLSVSMDSIWTLIFIRNRISFKKYQAINLLFFLLLSHLLWQLTYAKLSTFSIDFGYSSLRFISNWFIILCRHTGIWFLRGCTVVHTFLTYHYNIIWVWIQALVYICFNAIKSNEVSKSS